MYVSGTQDVRFEIPHDTGKKGIFRYMVTLPPYLTCSQCVVQWNYYTGMKFYLVLFLVSTSLRRREDLLSRLFGRKHVGHVWQRYRSCRMRQTGNFQKLCWCKHRYQHRWNTTAISVSECYLWVVLRSSEILDCAARSTAQVRIDAFREYERTCVYVCVSALSMLDCFWCDAHVYGFYDFRVQVCEPTAAYRYRQNMTNWCQVNCIRIPSNCPPGVCHCLWVSSWSMREFKR